ncbi:protein phosphatase 2C domain-containing protein [Streptomyces piniterrae]|uniref:Protein phosphatase 2C domain-containing protein n=1 Tax=Streptomyces piniterrae TaxID=2571125 RepID=A0A4U0MMR3_9ACTN|nr:protein phosphatase 2C domain-containing protein [Streptomyces piniterrae]TJZ41923.1 protein phosphatase 2C domain-containing protein [Streptomyces piniterrae]
MSHRAPHGGRARAASRLAATAAAIAALLLWGGSMVSGGRFLPVAAAAAVGVTGLAWLRVNKLLGRKDAPAEAAAESAESGSQAVAEGRADGEHESARDSTGDSNRDSAQDAVRESTGGSVRESVVDGAAEATAVVPPRPGPSGTSEGPAGEDEAVMAVSVPGPPVDPPATPAAPPAEPDGGSDGCFPVLHTPSRAAGAPWLLPSDTATHGVVADQALLGELHIRAASVVGPGHRAQGTARQDAYRLAQDRHGRYLIVVVADGMSDSRHADVGASAAVTAMAAALREALDGAARPAEIDPREIFLAAAARMYRTAESRHWDPDDMRAVAVAAVVPVQAELSGVREVWLASMGDASAWRLHDGTWQRLIGDGKGSSETGLVNGAVENFLPFEVERFACRRALLTPDDVLAVLTDGVADALDQVPEAGAWFAGRWRQPPPVGAFLLDVGFQQTQLQDDRTAVAVWCGKEERAR